MGCKGEHGYHSNKKRNSPPTWEPLYGKSSEKMMIMMLMLLLMMMMRLQAAGSDGSGVMLRKDGHNYLITAAHVVRNMTSLTASVLQAGGRYAHERMQPVHIREDFDLAALAPVHGTNIQNYDYADITANPVGVEERVYAISNPFQLAYTCTRGSVTVPYLSREDAGDSIYSKVDLSPDLALIDIENAQLLSGSSGGPCFNRFGEVVGIILHSSIANSYLAHFSAVEEFMNSIP